MFHDDSVIALLRDLVAIDSVNPTLVPGARAVKLTSPADWPTNCARAVSR
jgi:hypothetical protein